MKKKTLTLIIVIPLVLVIHGVGMAGQPVITSGELTFGWDHREAFLVPENGPVPPKRDFDQDLFLLRGRLQNRVGHPVVEMAYRAYEYDDENQELDDFRGATLLPFFGVKKTFIKLVGLYQDAEKADKNKFFSGYLIGDMAGFQFAVGLDDSNTGGLDNQLYSIRIKRDLGKVVLMGGYSHETEAFDRYGGGAVIRLPGRFLAGGGIFDWDGEAAYGFNMGRYTEIKHRTDPSFSINYLDVPNKYKWTNFRIMWGRPGINYVPPTFLNPVFSGQYDLDMALLLNELMPDNYRHFDSPLLYRRFDEYGRYTLRMNYIELENGFERFDANFSYSPPWAFKFLERPHVTLTYDNTTVPAFGEQPDRYWIDMGVYLFKRFYVGAVYVSDFEDYDQILGEVRYHFPLK